ncbi:MAG: hypothetical protein A3K59_00160 [Euryarchaeota archaeon RBG_19FT_COMBO_69_17]|nr:MAG: hypothetical protein A3K59_00160 [Euryarchaeota archaeon RBG_19FT_COMBO_69_17]
MVLAEATMSRMWFFEDLLGQHVVIVTTTGREYKGFVREAYANAVLLADGDGTAVALKLAYITSVQYLPPRDHDRR